MARYSDVITLINVTHTQNDEGVVIEVPEETDTFCNRFSVSLDKKIAGKSAGLNDLAVVQLRSNEYNGQPYARFDGIEYTVDSASDTGEFVRLNLSRRLSNG